VRHALALGLCLVGTVAAGCGGSDGNGEPGAASEEQTIPAARYVEQADELCRDLAVDVQQLRTQARLRTIQQRSASEREAMKRSADVLAEQLTVIAEFRRKFAALGTPDEHRDDAEGLLDKSRAAEEELERAIDALRQADEGKATGALQRYFGFSQQSASIARDSELDFAACGVGA
jgi:hypothetical protein